MDTTLIKPLLLFGIIGITFGIVSALLFRRSRHPFLKTTIASAVAATLGGLLISFVLQTLENLIQSGQPLEQALLAGVGAMVLLVFAIPFICGGPAVFAGSLLQLFLQRTHRPDKSQPPPVPH